MSWKSFSYFLKKTLVIFSKRNFLVFRERYIQNPAIFRTRSIFRNLVCSKPETYSEHCQTSTIEHFAKIATWRTFQAMLINKSTPGKWNFLTLTLKNFLYFLKRKLFLYLTRRKPRKKILIFLETELFYILGNGNLKKIRYISGKGTLLYFMLEKWKNSLWENFLYFRKWNYPGQSLKKRQIWVLYSGITADRGYWERTF